MASLVWMGRNQVPPEVRKPTQPRGMPGPRLPSQSLEAEAGLRQERGDPLPCRPPAAASAQQADCT